MLALGRPTKNLLGKAGDGVEGGGRESLHQGVARQCLRKHLDNFLAKGVPERFQDLGSKGDKVMVHADFSKSLGYVFLE